MYVMVRMVHVRGWRRLAVAIERDGHAWCGVELDPACREDDAREWSQLFERRYRRHVSLDELLAEPWRFEEIYLGGGIRVLLNEVERQQVERERLKREARR